MAKPILLLVDNHANEVSALVKALTLRYGSSHDIQAATTAAQAQTRVAHTFRTLECVRPLAVVR